MSAPADRESSPAALLAARVSGLALDRALAADLDARATRVHVSAGRPVFEPGNTCSGFLVLLRGVVRVSGAAADGREVLLYRVRPGETCLLTLGCLMGGTPYPARGEVEADADALLLPAPLFERLTAESPAFRRFVFGSFSSRLHELLARTESVAFAPLERRLAAALLERCAVTGRIELPVTHADLARELGGAREPVTRALAHLAAAGAVSLGRGRIQLLDRAVLERLAAAE